jgi:DNA-directed RNA polymerase specialized sigma24 family protein
MSSLTSELKVAKMREKAGISERERASDLSALELLYRRYAGHVYTICLRLLAGVRVAEEATVTVFVRFGREAARLLEDSTALSRLRELAIEEALSRLNLRGRKAQMQPASSESLQSFDVGKKLDRATLDSLTARLPDHMRVAFVLHDREGLSHGAIAAHLRTDEAEVRRLVQVSRMEVRRLWREAKD